MGASYTHPSSPLDPLSPKAEQSTTPKAPTSFERTIRRRASGFGRSARKLNRNTRYLRVLSDLNEEAKLPDLSVAVSPGQISYTDSLPDEEFRKLQIKIRNCPGEIREKIMDHFLESELVPK